MARIYKETRLDLRPYSPDAVVNIQIPPQGDNNGNNTHRRARFSLSSFTSREEPIAKDEEEFARRYVATQGSVYFRKRRVYPRIFLWRVIGDDRILEIQCADLVKGGTERFEYNITLRLHFQEAILPCGVALADLEDHEVLNVFVITTSKQLYTLTLRPELFRRSSAIDENVSDWCKSCVPAPLAFSYPHRLYASSSLELFISLDNGSLLRLNRRAGDDGSYWSPLTLDERTWGASIRGFLKWNMQSSIKYQGRNLDRNAVNAVATTSDQTHLFAVCLNHTLKIWNLSSNRLVAMKDLLDRPIRQDVATYMLNPSESSFVRVFNAERAMDGGYRYFVVTYSPYEDGRFKFWAVKGGLTSDLIVEDLFPDADLKPLDPDPTGNVFWTVADFQLKQAEEGKNMELWVLWRNKNIYQLYSVHFDFQSLVTDWSSNWVSTALEVRRQEPPPPMVLADAVDATDKWLQFLLQPGRFLPEVLETALVIYQEALRPLSSPNVSKRSVSLQERLCSTIAATVSLRKYAEEDMDFARYRTDTDSKWRAFWQIAEDLNKRRTEPVSLAYDFYYDVPWLLLSDSAAVIRECSSTELLLHNSESEISDGMTSVTDRWRHRNLGSEFNDLFGLASFLIKTSSDFRSSFPAELESACQAALEAEIFTEPMFSVPDRIAIFQDRCDFAGLVDDKDLDSLLVTLNARVNVYSLPSEVFYAIIETVPLGFPGKDSDLRSTYYGIRAIVNGARETISYTRQILFDLLVLIVFLDGEVDQDEDSNFDTADLFINLIEMLREYEMMAWLCSNVRRCPDRLHDGSDDATVPAFSLRDSDSKGKKGERMTSILEDLFAKPIKPRQAINMPQSYALTLGIRDVLSWVTRQGEVALPNALVFIQCDLLAKGNVDLAWDFLRFQISTSWATYVKGRLYVAMYEYDTAAVYFRKAAYLLSCGKPLGNLHEMSSTLLDIVSVDSFYNGLPKYFQHILSIFEQARSFSHVADFAGLALQALESEHRNVEEDTEYVSLRTDLLSRLFYASLKTAQFDEAYSAISRYNDRALQKSALGSLVTNVLAVSGPGSAGLHQLLHFPTSLVPNIASYVDETLVSLSKKQTSFTSFLEDDEIATTTTANNNSNKFVTADNNSSPDYCRILQAYRIARNDYRGAAEIAYRNVQRLRKARDSPSPYGIFGGSSNNDNNNNNKKGMAGSHQNQLQLFQNNNNRNQIVEEDDPESKEIRHELLALINLLACVDKSEAYILVEKDDPFTIAASHNTIAGNHAGGLFSQFRRDSSAKAVDDEDGNALMDDTDDDTTTTSNQNNNAPSSGSLFSKNNNNNTIPGRKLSFSGGLKFSTNNNKLSSSSLFSGGGQQQRVIVTLDHLRREYQAELDRVSRIERGDWEFGLGDYGVGGEEEVDNDETMVIS